MQKLTFNDAVRIWLLLWQGWKQHDIAALYGVNQGRISEIHTGKRFPGSEAVARQLWLRA